MVKDNRRYPRYALSARAVITGRQRNSAGRLATQVTNISLGGVGLYSDIFWEETTPVTVEFLSGNSGKDIFDGRIASVSLEGDNYFMGVSFDREISYDRLSRS
jgi:hypothetical protein